MLQDPKIYLLALYATINLVSLLVTFALCRERPMEATRRLFYFWLGSTAFMCAPLAGQSLDPFDQLILEGSLGLLVFYLAGRFLLSLTEGPLPQSFWLYGFALGPVLAFLLHRWDFPFEVYASVWVFLPLLYPVAVFGLCLRYHWAREGIAYRGLCLTLLLFVLVSLSYPWARSHEELTLLGFSFSLVENFGFSIFGLAMITRRMEQEILEAKAELERERALIHIRNNLMLEEKVRERTLQLEELNQRLAEETSSKDRFFSILAHDLRGPIGNLAIWLREMIRPGEAMDTKTYHLLKEAAEGTHRLLEDLLRWSRSQRGQLQIQTEDFCLCDLAAKAERFFRPQMEQKGLRLLLNRQQWRDLVLHADQDMAWTVLRNLLHNALKFTPHGGQVELQVLVAEGQARFVVINSGPQIPPERFEQLFNISGISTTPRNKQAGEGVGLGLVLCKDFVEKMQGQIGAATSEEGNRFWFSLPLAA